MRYNNQAQHWLTRANTYVGKTVRDTYERVGVVKAATPMADGKVSLLVEMFDGYQWYTDNEHATIVRDHESQ